MFIKVKTPAQLADSYGALMAEKAALAKREKAMKAAMLATGLSRLSGNLFDVTISKSTGRTGFDAEKAKSFLSPSALALCVKSLSEQTQFKAKARVAEAA